MSHLILYQPTAVFIAQATASLSPKIFNKPDLAPSAHWSIHTKSKAVDNVISQHTQPPELVHISYSIRCHNIGYLSRLQCPGLLAIAPCHLLRVCAYRPFSLVGGTLGTNGTNLARAPWIRRALSSSWMPTSI